MRFREIRKNKNKKSLNDKPKVLYAKTTDRIKAFITDMFMIYVPILYIITYVFMDGKDDFLASDMAPLIAVSIYGVIYSALLSKLGQTPGKKAYEIKVVDAKTGNNLSFVKSFIRYVMFLFSSFTLLGLIVVLYRKDKKSLHDLVCGSIVMVHENNATNTTPIQV